MLPQTISRFQSLTSKPIHLRGTPMPNLRGTVWGPWASNMWYEEDHENMRFVQSPTNLGNTLSEETTYDTILCMRLSPHFACKAPCRPRAMRRHGCSPLKSALIGAPCCVGPRCFRTVWLFSCLSCFDLCNLSCKNIFVLLFETLVTVSRWAKKLMTSGWLSTAMS